MSDAEVAARSEAPVQGELMLARALPTSRRAEIQKVCTHRLLGLEGPIPEQDDDAGVRLANLGGQVSGGHRHGLLGVRRTTVHAVKGRPSSAKWPEH